jgi:hypothetical protein
MKLASLLTVAALCVALPAMAYDLTYMGPIKSKETKSVKVHLPDCKSQVEVWSSDGKISCQFATATYGGVVVEQNNVARCNIIPIVKGDTDIVVNVTNLENKDSDYRIWVHDPN